MPAEDPLALADYRRRVAELYARARQHGVAPAARWRSFRQARDRLFREHPVSALTHAQRERFAGLDYFEYDPAYRVEVEVEAVRGENRLQVALPGEGIVRLEPVGRLEFRLGGEKGELTLYWLLGYGGGLFLPFRDATNGEGTYGGGRYLLDTIKGADLGYQAGRLVLDFNYAYNPSCAYNARWHCPLPPRENWLELPIRAGEMRFLDGGAVSPDPDTIPQAEGR